MEEELLATCVWERRNKEIYFLNKHKPNNPLSHSHPCFVLLINVIYLVLFLVKLPEAESMYMLTYVFKTLVIKIRVSQMIAIFEVTIVCLCCIYKCGEIGFFSEPAAKS